MPSVHKQPKIKISYVFGIKAICAGTDHRSRSALLTKQPRWSDPIRCWGAYRCVVALSGSKHPIQADYNWPARVEFAGGKFICLVSPSRIIQQNFPNVQVHFPALEVPQKLFRQQQASWCRNTHTWTQCQGIHLATWQCLQPDMHRCNAMCHTTWSSAQVHFCDV